MTGLRFGPRTRFVVSTVCTMALGVVAAGCSATDSPSTASVTNVLAPEKVTAGSTVDVVIEGIGPGDIQVDAIDAFSVTTFAATMSDGRATVTLPTALTSTSGLLTFVGRGIDEAGQANSVVATTMIVAAEEATAVDIHAGPRTIIADGMDQTMVVAIAADAFGNPLPDGEKLVISLVEAAQPGQDITATVEHGIVAELIAADTAAGKVEVFATADSGASSRRVGFDEVPGVASSVRAALTGSPALVADGRALVEISTSAITDRFGNLLPDGHLVQLRSDGPDGVGVATATTIDGIGRFWLIAPARPGPLSIAVSVDGITSETTELTFAAAVSSIPVDLVRDDSDRAVVEVGPVLDDLGAVVTDGTPVAAMAGDRVDRIEVPLVDGRAEIDIGLLDPRAEIDIEVLGVIRTVTQ